ncbi:voltage-gated chloride channel [Stereum hirsutum FP-91666 SS1]|uniref:voltage-gated chloride channel n=1 Tax=Stereum hirsutum (strain FP-91666) TaxID=721885 RepID=UPI000444A1B4|nr:voltage-gated chloride channel [Stereum hirsutum FP-91666 SS1]EIM81266.1 voltage-gated chloride channel [Stereum hirsutum FP-91666 SS1]
MPGDTSGLNEEEFNQFKRYEDFTTIDWIEDSIIERNKRLRTSKHVYASSRGPNGEITLHWLWSKARKVMDACQTWVIVSLVGAGIGVNAAIISIVTAWLSDIKMGYCSDGWWLNQQFCCWEVEGNEESPCDSWHMWSDVSIARWFIYVLFAGIFSFVASHLVKSLAKYAAGSGISEIKCILAGFIMKGFLGFWTFLIKSLTLPLVIASGLSVGKEGPSVHLACTIGNLVASMFGSFSKNQSKMRDLLTAASAAGVAVAFGSPIGGVLFSIEEMSPSFSIKTMWRSFLCALVATVTLSAMNPFRTGKLVLFQVTYDRDWHFFEIIFFIILGVFGGLYGAFVIKFNLQVAEFRRKHLAKHGIAEAVTLAVITAIIGYFNRFLRIDMTESMSILFRECESGGDHDGLCRTPLQWRMANSLLLATLIRTLLVIVSYGCKVPAGIFVPSMAIGASFGRMVGIMVKALNQAYPTSGIFAVCQPDVPCITPGTYAFLGAAAALSGIMRITVTVVVIMFELTGALTYILPTMIVLLVTKAVGDLLGVTGIADEMIRFNGYPFLEKDDHVYDVPVAKVMRRDLHTLQSTGMTLSEVEARLSETTVKGLPVVSNDGNRTMMGYVGRMELRYVIEQARRLQDLPPDMICSFTPDTSSEQDAHWSAVGIDEDLAANIIFSTSTPGLLKLWPWVNQAPLTVSSQLPLEIVMQLFKRMGPRVILVEDYGSLVGLVTVKDVLQLTPNEQLHSPGLSWRSASGGLEGALEEVLMWIHQARDSLVERYHRVFSRR